MLSLAGNRFDSRRSCAAKRFLGPLDTRRGEYMFGHRDRVDEIIDMARSVRSKDYLYIRNFMPHWATTNKVPGSIKAKYAKTFMRWPNLATRPRLRLSTLNHVDRVRSSTIASPIR